MNEHELLKTPAFRNFEIDGVSKILLNVYQTMLEDGTIEKIARDQVAEMVKSTLHDAMSWNGPVKAKFKERIEPLMIDAVDRSDLSRMTQKLTGIINDALQASSVGSYREICDGIRAICGAPAFKRCQTLKLSEIFEAYRKCCKEAFSSVYFDTDEMEPDEHGNYSTVVYCNIEVTQERRYFGDGDYTITFSPECSDLGESEEDEIINNTFVVKFHKYEGKYRLLWLGSLDCFTLNRLPAFALYLQAAKDARCEIEIDMSSDQDDVEIDIER